VAANEVVVKFKLDADGNLKALAADADKAAASTDNLSKSARSQDRALKGAAQASSNSTKNFAKMSQGISGGLVPAYAALAANIFAITALFNALRGAARVEQLTKGLSEMGAASGLALGTLSRGLQESTGFALSLEEAMRSTALITSAGLDASSVEEFGKAAKNASLALGRDTAESLERFTRGVTKLEPELLDELGLFVRVDDAAEKYARSIGKSAGELTNFEKRQAFANEALDQANEKYGALGDLDVSSFDKLAATFNDLSKQLLSILNIAIVPFVSALATNSGLLLAALTGLGATISGQILGGIKEYGAAAAQAAEDTKQMNKATVDGLSEIGSARPNVQQLGTDMLKGTASAKQFQDAIFKQRSALGGLTAALNRNKDKTEEYTQRIKAARAAQEAIRKSAIDYGRAQQQAATADAIAAVANGDFKDGLSKTKDMVAAYKLNVSMATFQTSRLSKALHITRASALLAAGAFRIAGAAVTALLGPISAIIAVVSLLIEGFKFVIGLFQSKAYKEYKDTLESARETTAELGKSLREVDSALEGTSKKITTVTARTIAYGNALGGILEEVEKLKATGYDDNVEGQIELFRQAAEESDLFAAALKEAGIQKINKDTIARVIDIAQAAERASKQTQALAESAKAASTATQDFVNSFIKTTPVDAMADSLSDLAKAASSATEVGELEKILDEKAVQGSTLRSLIDSQEGSSLEERIQGINKLISKQQESLRSAQDRITTAKEELDIIKSLNFTTQEGIALTVDAENNLTRQKQEQLRTQIQVNKAMLNANTSSKDRAAILAGIQTLETQLLQLETKIISEEDRRVRVLEARMQKEKLLAQAKTGAAEATKREIENERALASLAVKTARARAGSGLDITDEIALLEQRETDLVAAEKAIADEKIRIIDLEFALLEAQTKAANARLAETARQKFVPDTATDELGTSTPQFTAEALAAQQQISLNNEILGIQERIKDSQTEGVNTEQEHNAALRAGNIELKKAQEARQKQEETIATISAGFQLQLALGTELVGLSAEKLDLELKIADQTQRLASGELSAADSAKVRLDLQNNMIAKREAELDLMEAQFEEATRLLNASLDSGKQLSQINKEIADLQNTDMFGNTRSITEAVRAAQTERRERLALAETEKDLKIATLNNELAVLQTRRDLLEVEMAARGPMTEQQANALAVFDAQIETAHQVAQLEINVINQQYALMKAKVANEETLAIMQKAREGAGESNFGGGLLAGATMATDLFNPDNPEKLEALKAKFGELGGVIEGGKMILAGFSADLKNLGPEGEAMAAMVDGTVLLMDNFQALGESGASTSAKLEAVAGVIQSIGQIQAASSAAKIAGIDKEIAAEKKRDGKSRESVAKLKQLEKKKEQQQRKAFEQNKKMQMASTIINTAGAAMRAVAELGPIAGIIMAGIITAIGAAQLAIIASTNFQGGGSIGGDSGPTSVSVGQRKTSVDMAKSAGGSGELSYFRGARGVGGPEDFTPAFSGYRNRAEGGNTAFMVGEQGPEMFVPDRAGTIIPNDDIVAPTAVNATFNISAVDATGVEDLLTNQRGNIIDMIREAANANGEEFLENIRTSEL